MKELAGLAQSELAKVRGGFLGLYAPNWSKVELASLQSALPLLGLLKARGIDEIVASVKGILRAEDVVVLDRELLLALISAREQLTNDPRTIRYLSGKWMAWLPPEKVSMLMTWIAAEMKGASEILTFAKTPYPEPQKRHPVYVPVFFDTKLVPEVLSWLKTKLYELTVHCEMYFKPDIFTYQGIYSGSKGVNAYIYRHCPSSGRGSR